MLGANGFLSNALSKPKASALASLFQTPAIRPVIQIYHDESTYCANADQVFHWTDGTSLSRALVMDMEECC